MTQITKERLFRGVDLSARVTRVTDGRLPLNHTSLRMKYLSKVVASVVIFIIGAIPLLASIPYCDAALSAGCCGPACPMMAKTHIGKAKTTNVIKTAAPPCRKVCITPDTPVAMQGTTKRSPNLEVRGHVFMDARPQIVITMATNATLSGKQYHRPRASLCIFLI